MSGKCEHGVFWSVPCSPCLEDEQAAAPQPSVSPAVAPRHRKNMETGGGTSPRPFVLYVAGPIAARDGLTLWDHVRAGMAAAHQVIAAGAVPVLPHLFYFLDIELPGRVDYEGWMRLDFALLARCDGLWRIGGESPGATREVVEAMRLKLPVARDLQTLLAELEVAVMEREPARARCPHNFCFIHGDGSGACLFAKMLKPQVAVPVAAAPLPVATGLSSGETSFDSVTTSGGGAALASVPMVHLFTGFKRPDVLVACKEAGVQNCTPAVDDVTCPDCLTALVVTP